jgi:hypothetical protein
MTRFYVGYGRYMLSMLSSVGVLAGCCCSS